MSKRLQLTLTWHHVLSAIILFSDATLGQAANTPSTLDDTIKAQTSQEIIAPEHRHFSLKACFDNADRNNKEVMVAAANLPISQAAIVIAKAIPNPQFSLLYGWGPAWQYIIAGNNQLIGWTEEIQVAGRRTKKIQTARSSYLVSALQLEAVRFDVHNRVRRAYAELAAAAAYEALIEVQQRIAQELFDISQKRFAAGKAPGSEVLQAKLGVMQLEIQHNQAQGRLVQDSVQIAQLLGETPQHQEVIDVDEHGLFNLSAEKTSLVPAPERGTPPLAQLLPAAWRERNDLKASIQQAYTDRRALTLAKTERIPDPYVGFSYLYSTYKKNQPAYFTGKVPQQQGYLLSAGEEIPIFYQYQGQINQAQATWMKQLKQNDLSRAQIAVDIVKSYEALLAIRNNIAKFQNDLLPAAVKVAQLSRRGYELGKTDLATAIIAQQQLQQMHSSYFDTVVAYQNAWADLEKAVGVPLNL